MLDGIGLGDGDGIDDGLVDGIGVVGARVGEGVGRFVGLHVVHESEKLLLVPLDSPNWKTSQDVVAIGGVLLQSLTSPS